MPDTEVSKQEKLGVGDHICSMTWVRQTVLSKKALKALFQIIRKTKISAIFVYVLSRKSIHTSLIYIMRTSEKPAHSSSTLFLKYVT